MKDAEARIIEAIMDAPERDGYTHNPSKIRELVRDAFAHFKERAEMREGELETKLELAAERDRMRREALQNSENTVISLQNGLREARKEIKWLEQRERDLEARAEEAEASAAPEIRRVDQSVYDEADSLMASDALTGIMDELARLTPPDDDMIYALAFFVACRRQGIPADWIRERMSRA